MVRHDIGGLLHVAAASEDRGRVVVQLRSGDPNPEALRVAGWIARSFSSSIEGLFVEDQQLIDLAAHGFVREVSRLSAQRRILTQDLIVAELASEARCAHALLSRLAARMDVPLRLRTMRDEPLRAMAIACAECGPWNVIVMGEPVRGRDSLHIGEMLGAIDAATGVVVVGPNARETGGRVVVVVEDLDRLPQMARTAERMLEGEGDRYIVLIIAANADDAEEQEAQARLALAETSSAEFATAVVPEAGVTAAAEVVRRLGPGLVIARIGGRSVLHGGDPTPLTSVLACPLFIVR